MNCDEGGDNWKKKYAEEKAKVEALETISKDGKY